MDVACGLSVDYNGCSLESVNVYKYLGLHVDAKLNWHQHINSIKAKISPYIFAIKRTRHILTTECLLHIYYSYIHNHFVYLNPIWSGAAKYKINELFILQKRAVKYVYKLPIGCPTDGIFNKIISLKKLNILELLIVLYKLTNGLMKSDIKLDQGSSTHNYTTRRRSLFRADVLKNANCFSSNVLARGLLIYNGLPPEIRNSVNLKQFKNKILKVDLPALMV